MLHLVQNQKEAILGKRKSLSFPGYYVVLYTFNGADPLFPIVGEIIRVVNSNHTTTTPTKWTSNGENTIYPKGTFVSGLYDFTNQSWWTDFQEEEVERKEVASIH